VDQAAQEDSTGQHGAAGVDVMQKNGEDTKEKGYPVHLLIRLVFRLAFPNKIWEELRY
jgi:hypothetical protein